MGCKHDLLIDIEVHWHVFAFGPPINEFGPPINELAPRGGRYMASIRYTRVYELNMRPNAFSAVMYTASPVGGIL